MAILAIAGRTEATSRGWAPQLDTSKSENGHSLLTGIRKTYAYKISFPESASLKKY
ncbi:hypothetical protein ACSFXN_05335 [Planococcus sp. 1R117A]|uniref:hypothetical protein n=1 Tax=Planococcus sp. 1R117A TaxID=3447020 RepID=UPI003EDC4A3D